MAPKENIKVNLSQLMHAAYIFAIWYGRSISWSIDSCEIKAFADHYLMTYRGRGIKLTEATCFLGYRWPSYGFWLDRRQQYFHKLLKYAENSKFLL